MLNNKLVCVVVPAFNEAHQIARVIETIPEFVDRIVVVNDCSSDQTESILRQIQASNSTVQVLPEILSPPPNSSSQINYNRADEVFEEILSRQSQNHVSRDVVVQPDKRLVIINHLKNAGVGAAIASGYLWAREQNFNCTAVMAGDGQMDPAELKSLCEPVVIGQCDYVKGNRLKHPAALIVIPKTRLFGNAILSILTKIASGYWRVSDTQTGYTAISVKALRAISLDKIYARYGMPNDLLVKLNMQNCKLGEIVIKPVYDIGEQSKMKIHKVIPRISVLLLRSFWKRIVLKYLLREFHPLFLLYVIGSLSLMVSLGYFVKIASLWITLARPINELTILAFLFTFLFGFQSILFAMWMDQADNENNYQQL